jgi:hypothetical protein
MDCAADFRESKRQSLIHRTKSGLQLFLSQTSMGICWSSPEQNHPTHIGKVILCLRLFVPKAANFQTRCERLAPSKGAKAA